MEIGFEMEMEISSGKVVQLLRKKQQQQLRYTFSCCFYKLLSQIEFASDSGSLYSLPAIVRPRVVALNALAVAAAAAAVVVTVVAVVFNRKRHGND